jgi:hypothetical protein
MQQLVEQGKGSNEAYHMVAQRPLLVMVWQRLLCGMV